MRYGHTDFPIALSSFPRNISAVADPSPLVGVGGSNKLEAGP